MHFGEYEPFPSLIGLHPYPQVIPRLFNVNGFGPPLCVTTASTCPWVDHTVSRLPLLTIAPYSLAFATDPRLNRLTSLATVTRRLIMQGTPSPQWAPTACKRMVSGSISLPYSGFFSPFLTVLVHYRSLRVFSLPMSR